MPLEKFLRIERNASAGLVLTGPELQALVASSDTDEEASYADRAEKVLDRIAETAQKAGRSACTNANCKVVCSGMPLLETVSNYDADLTARCGLATCDDSGIQASVDVFVTETTVTVN